MPGDGVNLWLVIPANGRLRVSAVAFAGIAWTVESLRREGIEATALVVAEDRNLELADIRKLETLCRPNRPLGKKWNDGYEHACRHGATHVMPCGSDDWIHPELIIAMIDAQNGDTIAATHSSSAVAPDGNEISLLKIPYEGGDGIRLLPASLLAEHGYRPTVDARDRSIDGAMRDKLSKRNRIDWVYVDTDPLHIVDFKSDENLTVYEKFAAAGFVTGTTTIDALLDHYPTDLVERARVLYGTARRS